MTKVLAVFIIVFGVIVALPAQAGVVTGEFVCNEEITVVNVEESDGVVTGEFMVNGVVTGEVISCDNGTTLSDVTPTDAGYIGVVTGE